LSVSFHISLPPCPPLFPYTTLFRSVPARRPSLTSTAMRITLPSGTAAEIARADNTEVGLALHPDIMGLRPLFDDHVARLASEGLDRKSTRLNSSHDQISYAVFCLKK